MRSSALMHTPAMARKKTPRKGSRKKSTRKKPKKRRFSPLLLALLFVAIAAAGVYLDYRAFLDHPVDDQPRVVVIASGMGASEIVDMLAEEDLISSPYYLRFYLWKSGQGAQLRAGVYAVPANTTVADLIDRFTGGGDKGRATLAVSVGMNLYELAERLEGQGLADGQAFLRRATDPQYAAELGVPAKSLEGYLAPGSYPIQKGTSVDAIIEQLHGRFRENWTEIAAHDAEALRRLSKNLDMGVHEVITLASVVEKEAVLDKERPVIARVFFNRFDRDMKLQSDPTCVYPPQRTGEKPSPARCRDKDNPYSTYVIEGLPPGPIGAPSRSAIEAVLRPYRGPGARELLFFVARNDGSWGHYFSRSYKEHELAIDHFLRKKRKRPPNTTPQP